MIYLDYSATTFPDDEVIKEFNNSAKEYIGNPNSSHNLGIKAKKRIDDATHNISKILNVKPEEIIYTSGASESNNLAIKGICKANNGKHIITTKLEHSSVIAPINRLCSEGYEVSFVNLKDDGTIDIENLKSIIREDTVLVSIAGVDSELGILQNINEIGDILKEYPNCYFHVDATQMIGKVNFDFKNIDLISFSAHKFFGIKGIGGLIKKKHVRLMSLVDGGKSTTKYRSGTPCLELITSLEKALYLAYQNFDDKIKYIKTLNNDIKYFLSKYDDIMINSTEKSIYQIINFSINNADKLVKLLDEKGIYLSTKSACSNVDSLSKVVMTLYNDDIRAANSIRISISYKTTKEEIEEFKKIFDECYRKMRDSNESIKI